MEKLQDDVLWPETMPELQECAAKIKQDIAECKKQIRQLMGQEDPVEKIFFATEIHEIKTRCLMLETQQLCVRNRIRMLENNTF